MRSLTYELVLYLSAYLFALKGHDLHELVEVTQIAETDSEDQRWMQSGYDSTGHHWQGHL